MSYRRLLVLYALILFLVAAQTISFGEESHARSENGSSVERPTAEIRLSSKFVTEMVQLFPMFTEATFSDRFGTRISKALEDLGRGNEDNVADVIADLVGTLNPFQLDKLLGDLEVKIKNQQAETEDDRNLLMILQRLKEAALLVQKKAGLADLSKFREAFDKKFASVKQRNQKFNRLLREAPTNDATKRELMAMGYDEELLLPWWREQCATGNEEMCNDLGKGIAFKDEKTGESFVDVFNGNRKQRLIFPGHDFKGGLEDLSEQTRQFGNLKVAKAQHETLDDPPVRSQSRSVNKGTSTGGTGGDSKPASEASRPAPPRERSLPADSAGESSSIQQTENVKTKDLEAGRVLSAKCFKCHAPTLKKPKGNFILDQNGTVQGKRVDAGQGSLERVIDRAFNEKDMPPEDEPQLTEDEKRILLEWARSQGVSPR